ncbi:YeeE/YedE family protein (plasmid) [Haloferax larsenii]|uniref:YeeE/YedE family protein n=1 Tax=Haloferax larsenii TaxID=302484 RepID=A0ABY5RI32_HALLR|nr:YeeE/YedE thiosulfate transporter family protein [Haloferax larsenii]UVE52031.1 YeeE/YedE family protein [Haloferax larsenii]
MFDVTLLQTVELFPRGTTHYFVGGLAIGLGVAIIYLSTAITAGNSTFLETSLSYVSDLPRFNTPNYVGSRDWRVALTLSTIAGAALYELVLDPGIWVTEVQWWRLLGGGILVGIGTRLGKGCTMGHGVCGLGSGSRVSLINVVTFVGVAIVTALLVETTGVFP